MRIFQNIWHSAGARAALLMTVGNVSTTVISAVAMILFSRSLGPSQFGIFSVFFSTILILSKIGDLGINIAVQQLIARATSQSRVRALIRTGVWLKAVLSATIAIMGLVSGAWIGIYILKVGQYSALTPWVFVGMGTVIWYEYANVVLQAVQKFGWSVWTNFAQSTVKLLAAIVLMLFGQIGLAPVVAIYILAPFTGALLSGVPLGLRVYLPKYSASINKEIWKISRWTSLAILAASLADNLDVILIQNYLSSYETGLWAGATKIAAIASLVGWSIGSVLNIRVAKYQDQKHLHMYLRKAAILALGVFIGISSLMIFSKAALMLTVGPAFVAAAPALNLLFVSTAILAATSPVVALFYQFDKPSYFAVSGVISMLVLLGADYICIPRWGIEGAGYARIIMRLIILAVTVGYAWHAYREKYVQK